MITENKRYKNINYYTKKVSQYLLLIEKGDLSNEEKEIVLKKLKNINEKLKSIKKAEELNIQEIKRKEKILKDEKLLNQFKSYLTNKNIYLNFKKENIPIPKEFEYVYNCFEFVNDKFKLTIEEDIDNKKIKDITDDFNLFIKKYNEKKDNYTLFNIFIN